MALQCYISQYDITNWSGLIVAQNFNWKLLQEKGIFHEVGEIRHILLTL